MQPRTASRSRRRSIAWPLLLAAMFFSSFSGAASEANPGQVCNPSVQCCASEAKGGAPACGAAAGNPLNVISGNKHQREVDMPPLPGVLGLELVRYYNSAHSHLHSAPGLLGRGWRLSYEAELKVHGSGRSITVLQADGRSERYFKSLVQSRPGEIRYTSNELTAGELVASTTASGRKTYTLSLEGGVQQMFDHQGLVVQLLAPTGEFVSLQRSAHGTLVRVTDPQGRSLVLNYLGAREAASGQRFAGIQTIDTPVGRVHYRYGADLPAGSRTPPQRLRSSLVGVTLPGAVGQASVDKTYHHEDPTHPTLLTGISVQAAVNEQGQARQGDGQESGSPQRLVTWAYDRQGRAVLSRNGEVKAAKGETKDPAPAGSEQVSLAFGPRGADGSGETILTNSLGQTTQYRFRSLNGEPRLAEVRGPGCTSCGPSNVRYEYNRFGQRTAEIALAVDGKPLALTRFTYDGAYRLIHTSQAAYRQGKLQPEGRWQRFEYGANPHNRRPVLVARPSVVPGREHQTLLTYNAAGQVTQLTERGFSPAAGDAAPVQIERTTRLRYERINGRSVLREVDGPLANGPLASPQDSDITRYEWDARADYLVGSTAPGMVTTRFSHDEAGRINATSIHDGFRLTETRTAYADLITAAMQAQTVSRRAWTVLSDGRKDPDTEQSQRILVSAFDLQGRIRTTTDAVGLISHYTYDGAGRVQRITNSSGREATTSSPRRDESPHRLALTTEPVALASGSSALRSHLGAPGSVAQTSVLSFETSSRSAQRLIDDFQRTAAIRNPGQGWQYASYDEADRITRTEDPRGAVALARYNPGGRLVELRRFAPRQQNNQPEQTIELVWQGALKVSETVRRPGQAVEHHTTYRYNALGWLEAQTAQITPTSGHAFTFSSATRFDANGRRLSKTLPSGERLGYRYYTDAPNTGQLAAVEQVHWPHWLDWLVLRLPERWQPKTVLAKVPPRGHPDTDPLNPSEHSSANATTPPEAESGLGEPALPADLDEAGLPRRITTPKGEFQLTWNAAAQLDTVSAGLVASNSDQREVARYTYDAQGRRASKTTAQSTEYYFYKGLQLTAVAKATRADGRTADARTAPSTAPSGQAARIENEFVYAGYRALAWLRHPATRSGKSFALETDARGALSSVRKVGAGPSGDPGDIVWTSGLTAWGARNESSATTPELADLDPKLRLVNQYHDQETGLHYNIARYYNPHQGRFISPDPAGISDSIDDLTPDAIKLDTTAYGSGQPSIFFDPDGAAKLTYYAITTDAKGKALGTVQGFTKARWAFTLEDIKPVQIQNNPALSTLNSKYAANKTGLLYDPRGSFLAAGTSSSIWHGPSSATLGAFSESYGANLISLTPFTINDFDDESATLLMARFIAADLKTLSSCPAAAALLPDIKFAAEEPAINVTSAAGEKGATQQRIVACGEGSATDLNKRRIAKYEAAAEVNETYQINRDCSKDGCPGIAYYCDAAKCYTPRDQLLYGPPRTSEPVYTPSYGRSQFIATTLVGELLGAYKDLPEAERKAIGLTESIRNRLTMATSKGKETLRWFEGIRPKASFMSANSAWSELSAQQQSAFTRTTGLGEREYTDMTRIKTSPPRNSLGTSLLGDAKQAFATASVFSDEVLAQYLMGLFRDFDTFTILSHGLMRKNLESAKKSLTWDRSESHLAAMVARAHNGGIWNRPLKERSNWTSLWPRRKRLRKKLFRLHKIFT